MARPDTAQEVRDLEDVARLERALIAAERDNDWPRVYQLTDELDEALARVRG